MVCTPDHWHAIPVIEACKAGKDIYCQKPLSLTIAEGRAMSDAVKQAQASSSRPAASSGPTATSAGPASWSATAGSASCRRSACGLPGGRPDYAKTGDRKKPEPVPEGFDYDLWLGPGPEAPYAPARCHVNFRWIYDYSGGQVTDWGGHHPDCAQWGMGTEHDRAGRDPQRQGRSSRPDPLWNTATEFYFEAVYENGVTMIVSNKEKMGVTFEGTEGTIYVNRGKLDANPKSILDSKIGAERDPPLRERRPLPQLHRLRDLARGDGRAGRGRASLDHHLPPGQHRHAAGPGEAQVGPGKEQIIGDDEAAKMLSRPYRDPWKLG